MHNHCFVFGGGGGYGGGGFGGGDYGGSGGLALVAMVGVQVVGNNNASLLQKCWLVGSMLQLE